MRIKRYILGLAAGALGIFSACNTDVEGPLYNGTFEHVSFDGTSMNVSVGSDETEVTIPVTINRGVLKNASTITFTTEASEEGIFSNDANGVITFAEGQNTATVNVTAKNLEKEQTYIYKLILSDEAVATADTITGVDQNIEYVIKVTREGDWTAWQKWNSTGTADFMYSGSLFSGDDPNLNFTYRQSALDSNRYQFRLEHWGYDVELILDYDKTTGIVSCAPQYSGYTASYGDVMVSDLGHYMESEDPEDYGTFDEEQGIISIPLIYYVDAGYYGYDMEYIYIDGYARADLSSALTYSGILIDPQGNVFAMGNLKLGADVEKAVALVVPADADASAVADALAAGEVEGTNVAEGNIQVPIEEGLSGKLQIVVAVINGDAVGSFASVIFEYYAAGGNPWKSIGTGIYTDDFVVPFFGYEDEETGDFVAYDPYSYQVEVEENTETPGLLRIKNAYAPVAEAFGEEGGEKDLVIHAENPDAVYFLTQPIGIDFGYGEFSIASYGGDDIEYFADKYGATAEQVIEAYPEDFGTLKDGVITLANIPRTDAEGNPKLDGEGNPICFQGFIYDDEGGYYAATNCAFKLVLPSASADVREKAKRLAAARNFENRLKAVSYHNKMKKQSKTVKNKIIFKKDLKSFNR